MTGGTGTSDNKFVSASGRFVAFESSSGDLTSNDTHPSGGDLFLRDLQTSTTKLVTVTRSNTGVNASSFTFYHGVSTDGRFVTFASDSDNLVRRGLRPRDFDISKGARIIRVCSSRVAHESVKSQSIHPQCGA